MTSLSFPDVNVWLALVLDDHVQRTEALRWWDEFESGTIAFCRVTQLSLLRLLTTAAVMNGKPLTMSEAWNAYDALFEDWRVAFIDEPAALTPAVRRLTSGSSSSPRQWADRYLSAFALQCGGSIVTFDRALAANSAGSRLL